MCDCAWRASALAPSASRACRTLDWPDVANSTNAPKRRPRYDTPGRGCTLPIRSELVPARVEAWAAAPSRDSLLASQGDGRQRCFCPSVARRRGPCVDRVHVGGSVARSMGAMTPSCGLLVLLLAVSGSGDHELRPVFWCSTDVRANETMLCAGDLPGNTSGHLAVRLRLLVSTDGSAERALVVPAQISESRAAFTAVIPPALSAAATSAQLIDDAGVAITEVVNVNAPELWWAQGDRGDAASASGWIRVFGRSLVPPDSQGASTPHMEPPRCTRCDMEHISEAISRAGLSGDWEDVARLSDLANAMAVDALQLRHHQQRGVANTTLTLTDSTNRSTVLAVHAPSLSSFSAQFNVPASLPAGTYQLALSNGLHVAELGYFVSALEPRRSTIEIRPARADRALLNVNVTSYGATGVNLTSDLQTSVQIDSSKAVQAAIAAAGELAELHGEECAVSLPIGRTYVQAPLLLGNRAVLRGQSTSTSALYFAENNGTGWENQSYTGCKSEWCGAPPALIANARNSAGLPVSFALEDLTIYVLGYYNAVVNISTETDGVRLIRVRIRADAFINRDNTAARSVPWQSTFGGVGRPLVVLQGNNVEISHCDMWGSWDVLYAREHFPGEAHTPSHAAHYLLIRNNSFSYGGSCYNLEQVQQVIMEGNICTGQGMSQGNGIATHGGGVAQHVFLGSNKFESIWGEDREVMTFGG